MLKKDFFDKLRPRETGVFSFGMKEERFYFSLPASERSFFLSVTSTVPRLTRTIPSEVKYRSIRETTSRAEPIYRAIWSWVSFKTGPSFSYSSNRKTASRWSNRMNKICSITQTASDSRPAAEERAKFSA